MEDEAWVELDWDAGKVLWAEFADRYQFHSGVEPAGWPAIVEPTPSVVLDLGPVFTGEYPAGFAGGCRDVAALVVGTMQDCTEWYETVVFHDWVHPSCLFRPHKVDGPRRCPAGMSAACSRTATTPSSSDAATRSASSATDGSDFLDVRAFYDRAAVAARAVIFTAT